MNRKIWLATGIAFGLFIFLFVIIVVFSFTYVKKNTDAVIRYERDVLVNLVRIPNAIPPSNPSFESISYVWEMETLQKEVVSVRLIHQTGFSKDKDKILAILEKPENADSSVFDKVLPAVVADKSTLDTAFSSDQKTSIWGNGTIYNFAKIERDNNQKVVRIIWEIDKNKVSSESETNFKKLNSLPAGFLKTLYNIQKIALLLFVA